MFMSDKDIRADSAERRKRVRRLKRYIVFSVLVCILIPLIMSFVLCVRVLDLNRTIDGLSRQVEVLSAIMAKQRGQLTELEKGLVAVRQEERSRGQESRTQQEEFSENGMSAADAEPEETSEPEITAAHKVYLTFDDGPSIYTDDILDILDQYEVKATFFVVGKETDSAKKAMKEIVERGHTLGMHSYTHKYADIYSSVDSFAEDFLKLQDYLYEVTEVKSTVYRFPGGSSNKVSDLDMRLFADYLDTQGVRFFDWNISSGDGGKTLLSVEELVENCTKNIERYSTSVILMHDAASKSTTVEALPAIIENILDREDTVLLPITEDTELVQHIH